MDDLLLYSRTTKEHEEAVREVLTQLRAAGLAQTNRRTLKVIFKIKDNHNKNISHKNIFYSVSKCS